MGLRRKFVEAAASQIGASAPRGDDRYIEWFNGVTGTGFSLEVPWCHIFVCWCASAAGVDTVPLTAGCTSAMRWFKERGRWAESGSYVPSAGDLIYFDWDKTGDCDHVGIVESTADGFVHTIEGNTGDAVKRRSYALTDGRIRGYGLPEFEEDSKMDGTCDNNIYDNSRELGRTSRWATSSCAWAKEKGFFKGDENGEMHWQEPLTREALAVVLKRVYADLSER